MDHMMSMFIDDELSIDEKITFVDKTYSDRTFRAGLMPLLHQEKLIRSEVVTTVPPCVFMAVKTHPGFFFKPLRILAAAAATALIVFFMMMPSKKNALIPHRFVIYQPDVQQVAVTGNFTDWKTVPMNRTGAGEYWEITLYIPKGEHRFTYILDGRQRIADPTIVSREMDDFGGENSILLVEI